MENKISVEFTKDEVLDILKTYVEEEIGLKFDELTKFNVCIKEVEDFRAERVGFDLQSIEVKGLGLKER